MLEAYNRVLASLRGDASQPGALNQLAGALADRINTILTSGRTADDQDGRALFQYDTAHPNAVARTLEVTPGMTTAQLAAIDAGPPYVSNGIPLKLGALASPQTSAGKIGDLTYTEFYGEMVSRVGDEVNQAREQRDTGTQLVSQARNLRNEVSAVSLDEEAITLMQFQRAYQATSQMIRVLSDLTGEAINLIR
jgi:flagellar hook-associated protein 1 FlgK